MGSKKFPWLVLLVVIIVLLATIVPYIYAAIQSNEEFVFGGFLLNPIDGNSYLAKMYQGWEGEWSFTLPYTSEAGEKAYLFLFYLALGHLAALARLPLPLVFHIARVVSIGLMLWALYRFCASVLPERRFRNLAFALGALGSGMGWLAIPFSGFTSDFWVAEAYPFLSAYANPHFPLGTALLLVILTPPTLNRTGSRVELRDWLRREWLTLPVALGLAAINPFGVVTACAVLGGLWIWASLDRQANSLKGFYLARLVLAVAGGLPLLVYTAWVTTANPYLRVWNEQNQTPSPPLWDLLLSFSPLLILALLGCWQLIRNRRRADAAGWESWRIPLVWAVLALIMVYFPWNLQRRFLMGFYIPLSILAPPGLDWLAGGKIRRYWFLAALVFLLALPTNLVILITARHAAQTRDPAVYLYADEKDAFDWLRETVPDESVILAAPETGLLIPAYSGLKVLYGHPFETVNAEQQEQAVIDAYSGKWNAAEFETFLDERGIDYVFYGPRERSLGIIPNTPRLIPAIHLGNVVIYTVVGKDGSLQ